MAGSDDSLQVGFGVFAIVLSLMVTIAVPILAPTDADYDAESIFEERLELEGFTGESMVNQTPWVLQGVYSPYVAGSEGFRDDSGFIYGESISPYPSAGDNQIGETTGIRLDPDHKSLMPLSQSSSTVSVQGERKWYYDGVLGNIVYSIADIFGDPDPYTYSTYQQWEYTGYMYVFDPMLEIVVSDGEGGTTTQTKTTEDAKLNLVWYSDSSGGGLSGGLVLYNDKTQGIVANITTSYIVSNYDVSSSFTTQYTFDFEGTSISINIKFDEDVLTSGANLYDAFNDGSWTLAITATSASDLLDVTNSTTFSDSVGNIIQTYSQIMTLSLPSFDSTLWQMVIWCLAILPLDLAMIMFLSRFGIAGLGFAMLVNILGLGFAVG